MKMRITKKNIGKIIFCCELLFFILIGVAGRAGFLAARYALETNEILHQEAVHVKVHNDELRCAIDAWGSDLFLIEQYAREHLQLARPGEYLYYLS